MGENRKNRGRKGEEGPQTGTGEEASHLVLLINAGERKEDKGGKLQPLCSMKNKGARGRKSSQASEECVEVELGESTT